MNFDVRRGGRAVLGNSSEENGAGERCFPMNGCPSEEGHTLNDEEQNISGPAFADCASCENQIGTDYEILTPDADYNGATVFPANLIRPGSGRDK